MALLRKWTCKDEASDVSFSNVAYDFVYRVVKMNWMPYLHGSLSAKEPQVAGLFPQKSH